MQEFTNILLMFDPRLNNQPAIERATELALRDKARLNLIWVVEETPRILDGLFQGKLSSRALKDAVVSGVRERLDAQRSALMARGVDARVSVVSGIPFIEVIRDVVRERRDLLIATAEGKGTVKARLFGSTSMQLMRKCPCPVWVIKPSRRVTSKRILAAVDVSESFPDVERESLNPAILELAASIAQADGAELHVVQAWTVYFEGYLEARGNLNDRAIRSLRTKTRAAYSDQLADLLSRVDIHDQRLRTHLIHGEPSKAITALAQRLKIDLLVMGTVCRTGVSGFLIGNTAERVLSRVGCSVLTVKPAGFQTSVGLKD